MMALLMSRVESSSPPGVCSVNTISAAPSASAFAIADRMNSELTGMDDPVDGRGLDDRAAVGGREPTRSAASNPAAISSRFVAHGYPRASLTFRSGLLIPALVDSLLQRLGLGRARIQRERLLHLGLRLRPDP